MLNRILDPRKAKTPQRPTSQVVGSKRPNGGQPYGLLPSKKQFGRKGGAAQASPESPSRAT
jgi:hypothetical protein